jgi:hypothetical protein
MKSENDMGEAQISKGFFFFFFFLNNQKGKGKKALFVTRFFFKDFVM